MCASCDSDIRNSQRRGAVGVIRWGYGLGKQERSLVGDLLDLSLFRFLEDQLPSVRLRRALKVFCLLEVWGRRVRDTTDQRQRDQQQADERKNRAEFHRDYALMTGR